MFQDLLGGLVQYVYNKDQMSKLNGKNLTAVSSNTAKSFFTDKLVNAYLHDDKLICVNESKKTRSYNRGSKAIVTQIVDGDTITIKFCDNYCARVRLLGIDCPEVSYNHHTNDSNTNSISSQESNLKSSKTRCRAYCYGKQAMKYTKHKLEGNVVYINFDLNPFDQYNRLLLFIYFDRQQCMLQTSIAKSSADNISSSPIINSFNYNLVRNGYACSKIYTDNPTFKEEFNQGHKLARESNVGAWSRCPDPFKL